MKGALSRNVKAAENNLRLVSRLETIVRLLLPRVRFLFMILFVSLSGPSGGEVTAYHPRQDSNTLASSCRMPRIVTMSLECILVSPANISESSILSLELHIRFIVSFSEPFVLFLGSFVVFLHSFVVFLGCFEGLLQFFESDSESLDLGVLVLHRLSLFRTIHPHPAAEDTCCIDTNVEDPDLQQEMQETRSSHRHGISGLAS